MRYRVHSTEYSGLRWHSAQTGCGMLSVGDGAVGMRRPIDVAPFLSAPFFCSERDKHRSRSVIRRHRRPKGDWQAAGAFEGNAKI